MTIICSADSNISLTATIYNIKLITLNKSLLTRRRKAKHNLAQCNYFSHLLYYK